MHGHRKAQSSDRYARALDGLGENNKGDHGTRPGPVQFIENDIMVSVDTFSQSWKQGLIILVSENAGAAALAERNEREDPGRRR